MNIKDIPAPQADNALVIRNNIAQVESALTEFDKISAGLTDLAARYPVDLVYDVTTSKGMTDAIAHRAAWREPRITVEKYRKTAKAPVLALGKDIDARAAWLTEQLLIGETPVDDQIKAEERRKEEVKQAKIDAEFGRVQAIQEAIAELHMEAMAVAGKPSSVIGARLDALREEVLDPLVFQEQMAQAKVAKDSAIAKMEIAYKAALHTEAEAAKIMAERAELEQLRAAQAEQKRKDEAAAAEARKAEEARLSAERKAAQEEQKRLDAQATAARAEEDRKAAAARKEAQATHEAEMKRQRDELAEKQRAAAEKEAKEAAKRKKAEAAEKRLRDAAGTMLAALRSLRAMVDGPALKIIDDAIKTATGE